MTKWYDRIGNSIEMFDGRNWVKGKVVNGYRTFDGAVTMCADEDKEKLWCSVEREGTWFRKCEDSLGDLYDDNEFGSLNPIIEAMKFAVNRYIYDYANSEDEYKKIIHESLIRARYLLDKMEIYGVDVYGKNYSEWKDDVDNKTHVIFMSDEEMKEWNKCAKLAKVLKEGGIL